MNDSILISVDNYLKLPFTNIINANSDNVNDIVSKSSQQYDEVIVIGDTTILSIPYYNNVKLIVLNSENANIKGDNNVGIVIGNKIVSVSDNLTLVTTNVSDIKNSVVDIVDAITQLSNKYPYQS